MALHEFTWDIRGMSYFLLHFKVAHSEDSIFFSNILWKLKIMNYQFHHDLFNLFKSKDIFYLEVQINNKLLLNELCLVENLILFSSCLVSACFYFYIHVHITGTCLFFLKVSRWIQTTHSCPVASKRPTSCKFSSLVSYFQKIEQNHRNAEAYTVDFCSTVLRILTHILGD